ncbi:MAG: NlpC/P60 family protein [Betaproteobacteria bacterium]|nr:MAG: NlpC/P60 family protein [Betaproteobacteria bacterium]
MQSRSKMRSGATWRVRAAIEPRSPARSEAQEQRAGDPGLQAVAFCALIPSAIVQEICPNHSGGTRPSLSLESLVSSTRVNHARGLLARAVKNSSQAQSSQSEALPGKSKNFALSIRSPAWCDTRMTLKGIKGLSIAALASFASIAAAPACAEGDAAARIEVGFATAYRASTFAAQMVGRPYRTGGAAPASGFDCSGLVQFSFRQAGVILPRSAAEQRQAAARVRVSHLRHGDLLFFDLQGKRNSHVGIYVGDGQFVHAPSTGKRVRKDRLDSPFWRKHLSEARRFDALDV